MLKWVSAAALLVLALFFGTNLFSPVRFDQEKIEVWVVDGQIQVRGLYHYRNRTILPASFSFGLPFPVDTEHPAPSMFSVSEDGGAGNLWPVDVASHHGAHVFRVLFWPLQEKWIEIDYLQGTRTQAGRYILESTQAWRRPINHGEYILHLRRGLELTASTYVLTPSPQSAQTYTFSRWNFYPAEDWAFAWRPAHQ